MFAVCQFQNRHILPPLFSVPVSPLRLPLTIKEPKVPAMKYAVDVAEASCLSKTETTVLKLLPAHSRHYRQYRYSDGSNAIAVAAPLM